ncbi:hypothetical protein [Dinghuibacter silviterrae]|uniref:Uncharacterized protein n=1 Tax=Dinghuibacter silviterrae TaxID=1539049 RepID=A0A4R8DVE4_9BACT|nr:hypothetical protein [Dinghuibacter silviterrae]TDX01986.1 hypothetical protein EDB95_3033 [Dinghuibacter silviterrae]
MRTILTALALISAIALKAQPQDTPWLRENTWFFENFDTSNIPWSDFRQSFIGVAPSPAGDFDQIFFNNLYTNTLYKSGLCFGMDVMSMLMMSDGGWAGYCHPPYVYASRASYTGPLDPNLAQAIIITHGNQINRGFLMFLLDVIASSENRDGNYAYYQVGKYLAQGDQPFVSISKDLNPADGAHVLVPYYEDVQGSIKRIFVYDPNHSIYNYTSPGSHDYYANGQNFITVQSDGTWSYPFNGIMSPPWTGSPSSGGNCVAIPLSVAGRKDRLPQSLFADAQTAINTIFIFGRRVRVRQVTGASGRKYLNRRGTDVQLRGGLRTILPFQVMGGAPGDTLHTYFVRGNESQCWEISAVGPYKVEMLYAGQHTVVRGVGDGRVMRFYTPRAPARGAARTSLRRPPGIIPRSAR